MSYVIPHREPVVIRAARYALDEARGELFKAELALMSAPIGEQSQHLLAAQASASHEVAARKLQLDLTVKAWNRAPRERLDCLFPWGIALGIAVFLAKTTGVTP